MLSESNEDGDDDDEGGDTDDDWDGSTDNDVDIDESSIWVDVFKERIIVMMMMRGFIKCLQRKCGPTYDT